MLAFIHVSYRRNSCRVILRTVINSRRKSLLLLWWMNVVIPLSFVLVDCQCLCTIKSRNFTKLNWTEIKFDSRWPRKYKKKSQRIKRQQALQENIWLGFVEHIIKDYRLGPYPFAWYIEEVQTLAGVSFLEMVRISMCAVVDKPWNHHRPTAKRTWILMTPNSKIVTELSKRVDNEPVWEVTPKMNLTITQE